MHIIIADKQYLVYEGIKSMLQKLGKYTCSSVSDYSELFSNHVNSQAIDCIIIDFDNVKGFNVSNMHLLIETFPKAKILVLTNNDNQDEIMLCLEASVDGYLLKDCSKEEFTDAFEGVLQGKKIYCQQVLNVLCNQYVTTKKKKNEPEEISLTAQEIKITRLASWGLTGKEMADKLNISIHTVNTHRKNIFKKIGVKNSSELVMYAMKKGLIDSTEYYI